MSDICLQHCKSVFLIIPFHMYEEEERRRDGRLQLNGKRKEERREDMGDNMRWRRGRD